MRGVPHEDKFLSLYYKRLKFFGKKDYLWMSQDTLLKWLIHEGLEISRRTLNRYLTKMRKRMILTYKTRTRHDPHKGMVFATTLQGIGWMGLLRLKEMGLMTWADLRAWVNKPKPFHGKQTSEPKKGLTPGDDGFYPEVKSIGGLIPDLIK